MSARRLIEAMDKGKLLALMPATSVWTALVVGATDHDLFVGRTAEDLYSQVAASRSIDPGEAGLDQAVNDYFATQTDDEIQIDEHEGVLDGNEDTVWIGVVLLRTQGFQDHVVAGATHEDVYEKLAEWCLQYWEDVAQFDEHTGRWDEEPPEEPMDLVLTYFERKVDEELFVEQYPVP